MYLVRIDDSFTFHSQRTGYELAVNTTKTHDLLLGVSWEVSYILVVVEREVPDGV